MLVRIWKRSHQTLLVGVLNDTASLQNCLAVPFKTANESVIPRAGNSTLGRLSQRKLNFHKHFVVKSLSRVSLSATLWTIAHQAFFSCPWHFPGKNI